MLSVSSGIRDFPFREGDCMPRPLAGLLGLLLCAATVVAGGDGKKALEQWQGNWQIEELTVNGKLAPKDKIENTRVVIEGNKMMLKAPNGEVARAFEIKLDPGKEPHVITTKALQGDFKDKMQTGIYDLKGDTLRICISNRPEGEQPTEFSSKEGSNHVLLLLKKASK
jgi:uncharacterized protein (TIGR03067 family)